MARASPNVASSAEGNMNFCLFYSFDKVVNIVSFDVAAHALVPAQSIIRLAMCSLSAPTTVACGC